MPRRRKRIVALIPALMAAVVIVVLVAQSSTAASKRHLTAVFHRSERRAFAVLTSTRAKTATVSSEPLPAGVAEGMSSQGLSPSEAVFTSGTYPTWVVPGGTEVCLVHAAIGTRGAPGASCASVQKAEAGRLTLVTETDSGAPVVFGLAPSNNSSVTVTDVDGTTHTVPVTNNVYEVTAGNPATVSLKEASGTSVTEQVKLPPLPSASEPTG